MHRPKFPPTWRDFGPGNPIVGEPPLPKFLLNPSWLSYEERAKLEQDFGHWAAMRAEAMVSPRDGIDIVRKIASRMYEDMKMRAGAMMPAAPARRARARRERAVSEPTGAPVKVSPPLVTMARDKIIEFEEMKKKLPTIPEQKEIARDVIVWAEEADFAIDERQANEIVATAMKLVIEAKQRAKVSEESTTRVV